MEDNPVDDILKGMTSLLEWQFIDIGFPHIFPVADPYRKQLWGRVTLGYRSECETDDIKAYIDTVPEYPPSLDSAEFKFTWSDRILKEDVFSIEADGV
ncbi:hypothetical protein WAI453_011682 [Rhynchosporium graminicola]